MTIFSLLVPPPNGHVQSPFNPSPLPPPSCYLGVGVTGGVTVVLPRPLPSCAPGLTELCLVQPLTPDLLTANVQFLRGQGWDVDMDNMRAVYRRQPHLFFLARTWDGDIIGHLSGVELSCQVGMLSYCIVDSRYQNLGLGSHLMRLGREAMGGRITALYSLQDKVPFYKHRGFGTRRFACLVRHFLLDPADFQEEEEEESAESDVRLMDARRVPLDKLSAYDLAVHGMERTDYLRDWILRHDNDNNYVVTAYDVRAERVLGYMALMHHEGRWDVSPLYADSESLARRLLAAGARFLGRAVRVYVRLPSTSAPALSLFRRCRDLQHVRVLYLMSDQPLPFQLTNTRVFSLSTVCYGLK